MNGKHIVIFAGKGIDRARLMDALVKDIPLPLYGFVTRMTERDSRGYHKIYLYSASDTVRRNTEENHVGDCNGRDRTVNASVFDTLGLASLKAEKGGVVLLDELGFMETGSPAFCDRVLALLDGDIPVLASAKLMPQVEFLNKVLNHPNVLAFELTKDNEAELYGTVSKLIAGWYEEN